MLAIKASKIEVQGRHTILKHGKGTSETNCEAFPIFPNGCLPLLAHGNTRPCIANAHHRDGFLGDELFLLFDF
jgi:hypothetical protein